MGSDKEVGSDFQLIAGTNRDLRQDIQAGRFREDLFARINLWTYTLPGLCQRRQDIEPNIDHQLNLASQEFGKGVRMTAQAKAAYLEFALSPQATWRGNFRDLSASITRMATLADHGRIGIALVEAEVERLKWQWQTFETEDTSHHPGEDLSRLMGDQQDRTDLFDRLQLQEVIKVCQRHASLSDAGRALFQISRTQRSVVNDADRLRKFLMRFGLTWEQLQA
jgi:transcriptional regulatory protein RtcR